MKVSPSLLQYFQPKFRKSATLFHYKVTAATLDSVDRELIHKCN